MNNAGCLLIGLLVILAIIIAPVLFLWSVNTLFGLGIAFTLKNILASLAFLFSIGGVKTKFR